MKVIKVLNVTRFKVGYEIRKEIVDTLMGGDQSVIEMERAYTPSGDYIGDRKLAKRLVADRGIQPQLASPDHGVCSIGYSVKDGKWWGWSHRARYGFSVGSKCKIGDCHYQPKNKSDALKSSVLFWTETGKDAPRVNVVGKHAKGGVRVSWTYSKTIPNKKMRGTIDSVVDRYPSVWGRGEWTALTTADARQMAVDFAEGVG